MKKNFLKTSLRAGTARRYITPSRPIYQSGYRHEGKSTGVYPGSAMLQLEREFPGAEAIFLQGCLGDVRVRMVNALGRFRGGDLEDIRSFGHELALAVTTGLSGSRTKITGQLFCRRATVALPLRDIPTRNAIEAKLGSENPFQVVWAKTMLAMIKRNGALPGKRPAVVQVMGIGPFRIIAFNDQNCIGYQLKLKSALAGIPLIVAAHCGNSRSYIPTADMVPEGGYEVEGNIYSSLSPAPLAADCETILIKTALRLAGSGSKDKVLKRAGKQWQ